jgi:hypothetical protein
LRDRLVRAINWLVFLSGPWARRVLWPRVRPWLTALWLLLALLGLVVSALLLLLQWSRYGFRDRPSPPAARRSRDDCRACVFSSARSPSFRVGPQCVRRNS